MAGFGRAQHPDRDASDGDAMFRAAFETAGHGMAIVGLDGRFLEANDACASIIGYSPPELQQLDVQSVTHPDDRGDELAQMQRLLEGEAQSYQMERRYIHKAGHSVWARLNVALIRDASNEPIYFVSQLQDITQGMHAREALRESELRFRTSLANLPGIVFRWRLAADGSIRDTYVSPHVADLLGIPPEMMARHGLRIMDFIHAEDRPRLVQELDRGARRLTASSIEVRGVTRPGGEMRWLQMHMTPRRAEDGSVEFDGIALDITQHRKLQDQLRLRERALDSISQAITIADASRPEYPIIYVNPAFERMTGYTPAEVIGHDYRFLEGPATDPEKLARKRAEMRSGRAFQGELVNHRKDGTAFVNEISITPVSDALGRLTHFVAVMNDVTTRHNLEAQLRQAVKIEAVGKLTGGVAHDFNNLLMVAHGNLELLSEALTAGESQVGELVDQAQKAILRGAELTRRLLAFARLQPLRAVSVDLNQLIVELVPLLSRTLGEDIQIETALDESLWTATIDYSQVENALLNLAVNARDAMPRGGRLTIATGNVHLERNGVADLPAGEYIRIAVSDTGEGMLAEVMERAFEPFFTTKEVGRGTGLGLSMVYGFARQSGGHVVLASEMALGTIVSLYLPRTREQEQVVAETAANAVISRGIESILLVEDDAAVRGTVRLMLEDCGYRVIEVPDGQRAQEILRQGLDVDLVLTDMVMPGSVNGWQLALDIWQERPRQKVLFSTGYTDNPIIQQAGLDPHIHVLRKPFGRKDLAAAVRSILDEDKD